MASRKSQFKIPWPSAPKKQTYFYYSLGLLHPMLCEPNEIRLSEYTRILKLWKMGSPYGKALMDPEALQASHDLKSRAWNDEEFNSTNGSHYVYRAFNRFGFTDTELSPRSNRRYEHADCAVEVRFGRDVGLNTNEMLKIATRELQAVISALRLLRVSSIGIIGPATIRQQLTAGLGTSWSLGNPSDPILSQPSSGREQVLQVSKSDSRVFRRLFHALAEKLPGAVQLAIRRLNLSMTRNAVEDQIVDAVVGLEAIYLRGASPELAYRLSMRVSAHQEKEARNRLEMFRKVRDLYEIRSAIVHGDIQEPQRHKRVRNGRHFTDEQELIEFARDILRAGCKTVLLDLSTGCAWKTYHDRMDSAAMSGKRFNCS